MTGRWRGCVAAAGLDVTHVMIETLSRVAAWFSLSRTLGAPTSSNVLTFLEPASFMCSGFSSMPQMRSEASWPQK